MVCALCRSTELVTIACMRCFLVVSLAIAGCASAGQGNSIIGGLDGDAGVDNARTDANDFPGLDAAVTDAPADEVTLSQASSTTITNNNSIACADNTTGLSAQNSYYRVFTLSDFGVTTTLHLTHVDFAIQHADGGPDSAQQPAQVILATYGAAPAATLDENQIQPLGSPVDIMIADGNGTRMTVPVAVDVPAGSRLLVELAVPDGASAGSTFFIGSNAQGERGPSYMSSASTDCGFVNPTTIASIEASATPPLTGMVDVILSVTGTR